MDCDENDFVGGFSLALCTANRAPVWSERLNEKFYGAEPVAVLRD